MLASDSALWFSAYAPGWGYCAFALPCNTVGEPLGAADASARALLLAFELGKSRILQAVERQLPSEAGRRITLSDADFLADTPGVGGGVSIARTPVAEYPIV
jgi:hypothetical protein